MAGSTSPDWMPCMSQQTLSFEQTKPFRHKVTAAWLSLLLGVVGAHHRYLGRRFWYVPLVFTGLAILGTLVLHQGLDSLFPNLLILPVSAGIIEAVILALRSPEKFDALYNPQSDQHNQHGWPSVLTAVVSTVAFANISLFWLVHIIMAFYRYMGWLDLSVY
ncbi:TM2 domain-containing protein [Alcaligenes faecalis]|nr:TM2 domain-containing protein [Providencia rettgeri]MBX7029625.1 TM2 domain-containing protein [Alcaligenes faecalis]QFY78863.1 TM2 domain-containing protein [Alcaligenes faecalis]